MIENGILVVGDKWFQWSAREESLSRKGDSGKK